MAVQHAQAPGGQDEQSRPRKQHAHELNGELTLAAVEARSDDGDERRCRRDADRDERGGGQGQKRAHGAGDAIGECGVAAADERRVDGDERCRQGAFAEQVLQEVRNAERRVERVCGVGLQAEIVGEGAKPHEPRDPAHEDAGGNEDGASRFSRLGRRHQSPPHRACRSRASSGTT